MKRMQCALASLARLYCKHARKPEFTATARSLRTRPPEPQVKRICSQQFSCLRLQQAAYLSIIRPWMILPCD